MKISTLVKGAVLSLFVLSARDVSAQGRVLVSHDEWYTGSGLFNANEQQFMDNTLAWFGVGSGSSVLLYTTNGFLINSPFQTWLTGQGISVTVNASAASFGAYDAVFTESNANVSTTGGALASYVFGGGNVLMIGGTGMGGEDVISNVFLHAVGLHMRSGYNGLGTVNTSAFASQGPFGAPLFTGVSNVYANNGSDLTLWTPVAGVSNQVFGPAANGVFAAAEVDAFAATPEPVSMVLVGTGLAAVAARRRRRSA